jgi:Tol biopolymer transport system component
VERVRDRPPGQYIHGLGRKTKTVELVMRIIKIMAFVFVCVGIASCKKNDNITGTNTSDLQGNIFFQPTYGSDLAPGLWAVTVADSTTQPHLVGAGMWYPRISRDKSTIVACTVSADTGYVNVVSPSGALQQRFSLGEWRYIHFLDPSPDGQKIVLSTSQFPAGSPAVAVVNRDGTDFRVLNDTARGPSGWPREAMFPTWSPDGSRIAYLKYYTYSDSTKMVLLTVNPDGSNSLALCETYGLTVPLWSPDGRKIACFQNPRMYFDVGPLIVRIVDVTSRISQEIVLTSNVLNTLNKTMVWGRDGILFCSASSTDSDGIHAIYRLNVAGSPTVEQISDGFLQSSLVSSPDGRYLAILGFRRSDPFSLYVMKPDGFNLQRLRKLSTNPMYGTYGFIFSFWL